MIWRLSCGPAWASSGPESCAVPCGSNCLAQNLKDCAITVGAGVPANTGEAGAIHRAGFFAGMPAPTPTLPF